MNKSTDTFRSIYDNLSGKAPASTVYNEKMRQDMNGRVLYNFAYSSLYLCAGILRLKIGRDTLALAYLAYMPAIGRQRRQNKAIQVKRLNQDDFLVTIEASQAHQANRSLHGVELALYPLHRLFSKQHLCILAVCAL